MTLDDIIAALSGNNQATGYLNDPSSNPAVGRTQRYPSGIPMPNATLGPDGMRLPLPRIQGTGAVNRMQKQPAYPLVFGPGAGAAPPGPPARTQLQFAATAPTMRFRDATATVGPEMVDSAPPLDNEPWRQPAPTPMYQGGGIYAGIANDGLAQGSPALRRGVEPPSGYEPPASAMSEDEEWNAALARVRETLNFERLNAESRKTPVLPRQGAPFIAQGFSRRAR